MRATVTTIFCAGVLLALACGCSASAPPEAAEPRTGQTFTDAMKMMCDVDRLAGLSAEEDPLAIGQKRSEWLAERIENPDGIEFRTLVSVKGAGDQAKAIRAKAKEVGIEACPLADSMEATSAGGLSP